MSAPHQVFMLQLRIKSETGDIHFFSAFLRTGIVLTKPGKKVVEKGHPEEWPLALPQKIHYERAVKKDGVEQRPRMSFLK